ncbi:protection of telomeres protein 1-like [Scleropages formosus]|uniref:Protection of telomeres protein 1 n=1 Tax=Scleropages formosus TaxID=113540 RepID=A0A0P7V639_SCLFO|nr:protection of telomeres protein 1-like [Scleropages formosus]
MEVTGEMQIRVVDAAANAGPQVPAHLQRIFIPQLTLSSICTHKFVKGKVIQKCPLVDLDKDNYILKTVIQEHKPQHDVPPGLTDINVIFFGKLAKEFLETVQQEDVVVLTGFTIGRSPTAIKDGLHSCYLQLAGGEAHVYVFPGSTPTPGLTTSTSTNSTGTTVSTSENPKPKYTYTPLKDLKPGMIVNIYGVVTFFKQPFRTKGTDYCSTLKITDESSVKIGCSVFSEKVEEHPKVFKNGDIIRLHRVQFFNGSVNVVTSLGFSVLTFDGSVGTPVVPRTSSRNFHFSEQDKQTVERLRQWATNQALLAAPSTVQLAHVQPSMYFDLTCQLLAKAKMDGSCTLLKVWDGTRCTHPLLNVFVKPEALEGSVNVASGTDLVANVLVYDNHVEVAQELKPGTFLRIYNLHAILQTTSTTPSHLCFHLHGGTSYGRGLRVLPKDSLDLQQLHRTLELVTTSCEEALDDPVDIWSTPPESLNALLDEKETAAVRTCDHTLEQVPLSNVKSCTPPRLFHVRAQVRSFQPRRLYQALKLRCPHCRALFDIPDDEALASVFQKAIRGVRFGSLSWAATGFLDSSETGRKIAIHLPNWDKEELIFLEGATLEEVCCISKNLSNIVPVRSCGESMVPMDLSVPFLFQGKKRHYGCRDCSSVRHLEDFTCEEDEWNAKPISEVLGIQPLQYALLMKMELEDESGFLETLLWDDAEKFFQVTAADVAVSQELQNKIQWTMNRLSERPWLELCIAVYTVEEGGRSTVCYQVLNTESTGPHVAPAQE